MAGVSNKALKTKQFSYDIAFDGALLSSTRASLVVELIKYFLYERQQIPLPVDQLKNHIFGNSVPSCVDLGLGDGQPHSQFSYLHKSFSQPQKVYVERDSEQPHGTDSNTNQSKISREQFFKITSERKAKCFITDLTQMFDDLHKAFESCPEIEQVAVIFGGTIVSPKESYLINFPPPCPDADCLPLTVCKRRLFQEIISEDMLGSMKNMSPTNMMLLVSAPRSCPLQGFLPKHSLHSPRIGAVISFNIHCTYLVPICHDLSYMEGAFELSGIEALDCSQCDKDNATPSHLTSENDAEGQFHEEVLANNGHEGNGGSTAYGKEFNIFSRLGEKKANKHEAAVSDVCQSKEISHASPSISFPRFCQHQRLNYIYTHKKKAQKLDTASQDFHMSLSHLSAQKFSAYGNAASDFEASVRISASPVFKSEHATDKSDSSDQETDCIWYLSPFTIKGFKCQESSNSNFRCF